LPEGSPTVVRLAKATHVSVRTLQRRLDARGLTWQAFLDRTRTELALRYLEDPSLSLSDIAMLLGYSEQSAFTRGFRRCTGTTPSRRRRRGAT
jgi:AraC-like DNA-binding protein